MPTNCRVANRLAALVSAFTATVAFAADPQGVANYRWAEHVRPAIEAAICVRIEAGDFAPSVTGGTDCPITSDDPVLASITRAIARSNGTLQWLFASKLERYNSRTETADPARRSAVERDLREMTLRDGRLVHRYMPLVHAVLADADAMCPNCPGPTEYPPRREVTLGKLMPYLLRYVWPDSIAGSGVNLHICAGSNGISELPYPDLDLADAALAALVDNPGIGPIIEEFIHGPAYYPDALTERDQLAAIRRDLHAALRFSPRFRSAVSTALARKGRALRVVCTDCRDAPEQLKAEPATPISDALAAYRRRDDAEALRLLRPLAEAGLPDAQTLLGDMYFGARGVAMNGEAAAAWYRKAAAQDHAPAALRLGRMYRAAQCGPRDDEQAAQWFRKAAELGDVDGMRELAASYEKGNGVPQDAAESVRYTRMAAERGDGMAARVLAHAYAAGEGVPQDAQLAYVWYSIALASESETAGRGIVLERERVATQLTPEELADAQRLAREWRPSR